jgi:hypothetical protein
MKTKNVVLLLVAAIMLASTFAPNEAFAVDIALSVKQNDTTCTTSASPPCFGTIQGAIVHANNIITSETDTSTTFSILVEAGQNPYNEMVTLGAGIKSLKGTETAKTKLTGNGNGTLITINGGIPIISNLYFQNAQVGIDVTNGATATIKNNIFDLGTSATAVQLTSSSAQTSITNNVFYLNNTVITNSGLIPIKKNIFHSNNTIPTIPSPATAASLVANNDFFNNNTDNPVIDELGDGAGNISEDPLFVNSAIGDFHLKADSPCIDLTTGDDIGAYGTGGDTIPFLVAGVTAVRDAATLEISVSWGQNLDYKVTGYRVYYGRTSGAPYDGTGASEGASPISVPTSTTVSATLSGLTATVTTPGIPTILETSPLNEGISLSWSAVDGASEYRVYWSESSFDMSSLPGASKVVDTTSTIVSGLTNSVVHYFAVSAIADAAYYVAVTAIYGTGGTPAPGTANESNYSTEEPVGAGEGEESDISIVVEDYPEALVANPNLPNSKKDCFIATAAYGHFSAPQVRALRKFRDQYLLTNRPGNAFVRWYYKHGPVAAAFLEAHPGYKPLVRAALMPVVGTALFFTSTTLFMKVIVSLFVLILLLMTSYLLLRKRLSSSGGIH